MVNELVKNLVNTKKTLEKGCLESGIEYSLFDQHEELLKRIDQCSICGHWRRTNTLHNDTDGFPTCKTCFEVYDL